jgi:CheY-like chemotaxis protein
VGIERVDLLLVEDDPNDVELDLRALRSYDLLDAVHVVGDGAQALHFLFRTGPYADRRDAGHPKVVLLDLKLPKVGGLEVLRRIRGDAVLSTLPVVVLTSSAEQRDVIDSYRLGVNSYITKPVDFDQFTTTMRSIGMYWLLLNHPPVLPAPPSP